jgi:uncharacterized protein (TIGR02996 family)
MEHPDFLAFLRAIVAEPDEDLPRLAFADWLDEHGDAERAAFIRTQVELVRLISFGLTDSPEVSFLRRKERSFLNASSYQRPLWAAELCPQLVTIVPPEKGLTGVHVEGADRVAFHRGFVEAVECSVAEWLIHGRALRQRQPIRIVNMTGCGTTTRDDWYVMVPSLLYLEELVLTGLPPGLLGWLRDWLPGTQLTQFGEQLE